MTQKKVWVFNSPKIPRQFIVTTSPQLAIALPHAARQDVGGYFFSNYETIKIGKTATIVTAIISAIKTQKNAF